jgi:hypothetical protein
MRGELLSGGYIQADEIPVDVPIQNEPRVRTTRPTCGNIADLAEPADPRLRTTTNAARRNGAKAIYQPDRAPLAKLFLIDENLA